MSKRTIRFTFLVDPIERQLITRIAERLSRSQADVLRFLIKAAAEELKINLTRIDQTDHHSNGSFNK